MNPLVEPQRSYTPPLDEAQLVLFMAVPAHKSLSLLKTPSAHFPSQLRQKSPRETEDGRLSAVSQIRWPAYHSRTNNKPGPDPAADLDPRPN